MAEQRYGSLAAVRLCAPVVEALPDIPEGGEPPVDALFHQADVFRDDVVAEIRMYCPVRPVQVPALPRQLIRDIPRVAVVEKRFPVHAAPVQLPHEIQCVYRQAEFL